MTIQSQSHLCAKVTNAAMYLFQVINSTIKAPTTLALRAKSLKM